MGEVLLPRISGILSSSLCKHQQIRNYHNCRPRIPHEQYPCGFSRRLLQCDVHGVSPFCRHFHVPCRLHRQWHLVLNTLHRWEWNTIVCSNHGSHGDEDCHSRRLATLWYRMFSWKCIPLKWSKEERSGRWTEILSVFHEYTLYCGIAWRQIFQECFEFITFHFSNCCIYRVKTMRNNNETDRNKSAQYKVKPRRYKWLLIITENL